MSNDTDGRYAADPDEAARVERAGVYSAALEAGRSAEEIAAEYSVTADEVRGEAYQFDIWILGDDVSDDVDHQDLDGGASAELADEL